ncbi:MAG: sulfatase modifying factor 1 [Verrucomicrobiales bacterium]|jgi:sulfatase modifying factor 1
MGAEENPSYFRGDDLPVEMVSWKDTQEFCRKLGAALDLPEGWEVKLPTEAQWEYACRAGTSTPFSFGESLNGNQANCDGKYPYGTETTGESLGKTRPVGAYGPNVWGLLDMHGNVSEWCQDWYGEHYYSDAQRNPTGPAVGSSRVLRGGSWHGHALYCRSAFRYWYAPSLRSSNLGLRVVVSSTL